MAEQKRSRGRPHDSSKATALLNAARKLLLSAGPDVTTDQIAAAAGVSKSTLYSNFGDKDGLIEAVIRHEADLTVTDEAFSKLVTDGVTEETLHSYGIRYMSFVNSNDLLRWDRLISALSIARPELPTRFFDLGPGRGQKLLAELLRQAGHAGLYKIDDPDAAADILAGLWLGFVNLEVKLGVRPPLGEVEIDGRVRKGLLLFRTLYSPKDLMYPI